MCLIVNKSSCVAEQDITCYKVVDYLGHRKYVTPWMRMPIVPHKEYSHANSPFPLPQACSDYRLYVDKGLFHTYVNFEDALESATRLGKDAHVFSATIPKGSRYYEGRANILGSPYHLSYASDTLILNKRLTKLRRLRRVSI